MKLSNEKHSNGTHYSGEQPLKDAVSASLNNMYKEELPIDIQNVVTSVRCPKRIHPSKATGLVP